MRTLTAILFILLGIVGIAGGIWGFSLRADSDINPAVVNAAQTVLNYTGGAVDAADEWLAGLTGGKSTVTDILNSALGDNVDLSSDLSVSMYAWMHALEILLAGIVGVETGLLILKFRK